MPNLLTYFDTLHPFWQNGAAGAALMLMVLIGRLLLRGARVGGKTFYCEVSRQSVIKHILYRDYVNSNQLVDFSKAYFFVFTRAADSVVKALCILTFFGGVWCVLEGSWLLFVGFYLAFNLLLDAASWLKDWSSEKHISALDEDVKTELLAKFGRHQAAPVEAVAEAKSGD